MKMNRLSKRWSANAVSRNRRLTVYEEEQVVEMTDSKRDEQEPKTCGLQRETVCQDDGQQMQRAGTRDLRRMKRNGSSRRWPAKVMGRNQGLMAYEEKRVVETTVGKGDGQEPGTYSV